MKNKILIFCNYIDPKFGGTNTSILNLIISLKSSLNIDFITRDPKNLSLELKTKEKINGKLYLLDLNIIRLKEIYKIDFYKYDKIYLNSFFDIYTIFLLFILKFKSIDIKKIILNPRGEFDKNALKLKLFKKKAYLIFYNLFFKKKISYHASSIKEKNEISSIINQYQKICVIYDFPMFINKKFTITKKRNEKLKIIYFGRISKVKNLDFCIDILNKVNFNFQFDIFGNIEDKIYFNKCMRKIQNHTKNKISFKNYLNFEKRYETLSKYHLLFCPSLSENYGNSIIESLSIGLPVIISDNTPWTNLEKYNVGFDINLNNKSKFINSLSLINEMDVNEYLSMSYNCINYFNSNFDNSKLKIDYLNLFKC